MARKPTPEEQAVEQIRSVFERSIALTNGLIDRVMEAQQVRCESCGQGEVSIDQLIEIHKSLTTWAAKFTASEAPKRLKLEGGTTTTHVIISDATITRLTAFAKKYEHAGLLPGAINVQHTEPS
jgi:hypothetical protein